jgi:hypothetical protein
VLFLILLAGVHIFGYELEHAIDHADNFMRGGSNSLGSTETGLLPAQEGAESTSGVDQSGCGKLYYGSPVRSPLEHRRRQAALQSDDRSANLGMVEFNELHSQRQNDMQTLPQKRTSHSSHTVAATMPQLSLAWGKLSATNPSGAG